MNQDNNCQLTDKVIVGFSPVRGFNGETLTTETDVTQSDYFTWERLLHSDVSVFIVGRHRNTEISSNL